MQKALVILLLVALVGFAAEFIAGPKALGMVTPAMAVFGILAAQATGMIIWMGGHNNSGSSGFF